MTGKEALEQRIKILEEENKNLKKDINMMCDEKHPYTWRSLMDERNNLRNLYLEKCFKLDEYKRAFEILKEKGVCVLNEKLYVDFEEYDENDLGFETGYYSYLAKEEYELLEELMKGEEIR